MVDKCGQYYDGFLVTSGRLKRLEISVVCVLRAMCLTNVKSSVIYTSEEKCNEHW